MADLKPCPFCGGKAYQILAPEIGLPSGDRGTTAKIFCINRDCGCEITKWALKPEWAKASVEKSWERRYGGEENAVD